jgi:hypothetical protein
MESANIDLKHLAQDWVHSHEEDTPTCTVFRPAHFAFPPSRGRKGFHLRADGKLIVKKPGPADVPETAAGTWKLAGDVLQLSPDATAAQAYQVQSVDADRLVVAKAR